MLNLAQSYGIRRPLEIAARCASLRPSLVRYGATFPDAPPVAPVGPDAPRMAPNAPSTPSVPYGDPRDAEVYFPFGVEEAPDELESAPSGGNPAPLWAVERAAILADAAAIEREFAWKRAGGPASPLAEVEAHPFRLGFDDLPAEYFALALAA